MISHLQMLRDCELYTWITAWWLVIRDNLDQVVVFLNCVPDEDITPIITRSSACFQQYDPAANPDHSRLRQRTSFGFVRGLVVGIDSGLGCWQTLRVILHWAFIIMLHFAQKRVDSQRYAHDTYIVWATARSPPEFSSDHIITTSFDLERKTLV